jgi:hypothetical protein
MTDFMSNNSIHYNDFNDEYNFLVCVEQATVFDEGNASAWSANPNSLKIFERDQKNEAEIYAFKLAHNLSEFPKGSYVSLSAHKDLFDFM